MVRNIKMDIRRYLYNIYMYYYFTVHVSMLQAKTLHIINLLTKYSNAHYRFKKQIIKNIMELQEMLIDPHEEVSVFKYFKIQEFRITYKYFTQKFESDEQVINILDDIYSGIGINDYNNEFELNIIIKQNRKQKEKHDTKNRRNKRNQPRS